MKRPANRWMWRPTKQWLPIALQLEEHPFNASWMDFGSMVLSQPLFQQSVLELRSSAPGKEREVTTDLATVIEAGTRCADVVPAGIIFHLSRCGSTLLSNALRLAENTTVLAEATPIINLLAPGIDRGEEKSESLAGAIRALVNLYSHYGSSVPKSMVIKLAPIDLYELGRARVYWPGVPFVIVIRNPVEVIASNVAQRPPWLANRVSSPRERRIFDWAPLRPHEMSDEEYCARAIGCFCTEALKCRDGNCTIISYERLDEEMVGAVSRLFGLRLPSPEDCHFRRVFGTYSKDPALMRPFKNTRTDAGLVRSIEQAAQRWAMEPYYLLRDLEGARLPLA